MIALALLVCFGTAMDVAAVSADLPRPLDFDREVATVGEWDDKK
jgi:hypothetical protein